MELNNSMTGGGNCSSMNCSAITGYEDYIDSKGRNIRVYGGLQGRTPEDFEAWWTKTGKYAIRRASPPKPKRQPKWSLPENPTRRQPSRSAKERMTKGGKRKSHKGHKGHKSRKSHKSHKNRK